MRLVRYRRAERTRFGYVTNGNVAEISGSPYDENLQESLVTTGVEVPLSEVTLLAPLGRGSRVVGVSVNYRSHAEECRVPCPPEPLLFGMFSTAFIGTGSSIYRPPDEPELDYEAELAVVIGRRARQVPLADADQYVLGLTCANDISGRSAQRRGNYIFAKSSDSFLPLGPAIVGLDDLGGGLDVGLGIQSYVNGELRQDAATDEMLFSPRELVAYVSRRVTLSAGDIILTGTPAGVGSLMRPPQFLHEGDTVRVTIDRIGSLENSVEDRDGA